VEGASIQKHASPLTPLPPRSARSPFPASRGRKDKSVLAAHPLCPSYADNEATKRSGRILFLNETILFDSLPAIKGSGAPKGALSNQCPRRARLRAASLCGAPAFRRSHFAALATGSTRWLSSRTGFPAAGRETGVSPASPKEEKNAAVKHAPCGPVFVPVDRGPRAARERIGKETKKSARGHRTSPSLLPSGTAPCTKRGCA
jgi:hypothetical protein